MTEYAFDFYCQVALRVDAPDEATARRLLREHLTCADANFGAWRNGDPILGEATLYGSPSLFEIDGETPETGEECLPDWIALFDQATDHLASNFSAWEDEEDSVKEEHETLIAETEQATERYVTIWQAHLARLKQEETV